MFIYDSGAPENREGSEVSRSLSPQYSSVYIFLQLQYEANLFVEGCNACYVMSKGAVRSFAALQRRITLSPPAEIWKP